MGRISEELLLFHFSFVTQVLTSEIMSIFVGIGVNSRKI
jgi:hypothetical protein